MRSLFNAGLFFLADLLSTLIFVAAFAITKNIYLATGVGIGAGIGQILLMKVCGLKIDLMQWMSLGLVVVLGGATLVTHNAQFIKFKPSVIYAVVGAVMLKPNWMGRYMPPVVNDTAPIIPWAFGYIWAALMFATAIANAVVAYDFDTATYAKVLAIFPLVSKLALFFVQFLATRILVRRHLRRGSPAAGPIPE